MCFAFVVDENVYVKPSSDGPSGGGRREERDDKEDEKEEEEEKDNEKVEDGEGKNEGMLFVCLLINKKQEVNPNILIIYFFMTQ